MAYKVQLAYFRLTGKFLTFAECEITQEPLAQIWAEIHELRRLGRLPGLRPNAGRDLFVLVNVPDHPERVPHLVMPPFINDDDVTPVRVPTGASARTTTRDIIKVTLNEDPEPDPEP